MIITAKVFMFKRINRTHNERSQVLPFKNLKSRLWLAVLPATLALMLSGCGGGDQGAVVGNFNIGVTVGGQYVSSTPVAPGGSINLAIRAGQSLSLDAGEPAVWTLFVGGSAINGGARVAFAGATITATTLNPYVVAVDTFAPYPLQAAIPISLVATSTYDSAQVANVNLLITN
ncbi:MAG: hypothetical protein H7224_03120 [Polaromonas sp.]|nr:hypothetical protein [Polaromonas sp.]